MKTVVTTALKAVRTAPRAAAVRLQVGVADSPAVVSLVAAAAVADSLVAVVIAADISPMPRQVSLLEIAWQ